MYLRLFPELVLRDTQRSGRSASNEISRRLHLWRQFQWEQLYKECRAPSKSKPNGPDPGLENDGDGALRRAAQKTRDGEYSRGAAALDLARRADTSIANFAVLLGLHPRAPLERVVQQLRGGRHIVLDADILAACAHGMPKSAALYLQPRHLRCIALSAHGSLMLAKVGTRVINGQVPGIIEPFLYDHKVVAFDKMSKHQADLHRREVSAALLQGEPPPKAKLRPIAIGEVMLRLAERTYARQMRTVFIRHLIPVVIFRQHALIHFNNPLLPSPSPPISPSLLLAG